MLCHDEFEVKHCSTGANKLYNVLKAYANLDPEVGYMQGMNFLAAMFILNVCNEEDAFWCFLYLMLPTRGFPDYQGKHNWRGLFRPGMPKALSFEKKLKRVLFKKCPETL